MTLCGFNPRITGIGRIAMGALLVLSMPIASDAGSWGNSLGTVRFEVTDARERIEREIDSRLLLRVSRVPHVRLANFGWVVKVLERPVGENAVNLLYHSLAWHGPYPTDIMAWHVGERVFPDDRFLRVQGHPYEIRITLSDIKVTGTGENREFVSGSVDVSWRRIRSTGAGGSAR